MKTSENVNDITGEQCFKSTNANSNFNFNYNTTVTQKLDFIKKHPIQPTQTGNINSDVNTIYYRILSEKKIHRTWLSILVKDNDFKSMYCSIYIAFGSGISNFSCNSGCINLKSMYSAI